SGVVVTVRRVGGRGVWIKLRRRIRGRLRPRSSASNRPAGTDVVRYDAPPFHLAPHRRRRRRRVCHVRVRVARSGSRLSRSTPVIRIRPGGLTMTPSRITIAVAAVAACLVAGPALPAASSQQASSLSLPDVQTLGPQVGSKVPDFTLRDQNG